MEEKILRLFKRKPDTFLSGEEISRDLRISRTAFWKHIEKLRSLGYEFDAVPHLGYRLRNIPDKLYPQEIKSGLKAHGFAKTIVYYNTTGSTNTAAYDLAKKGSEEGTVVVAEGQTHGRGRLSRDWASPKGKGIYMSVVLRPEITPFQAPRITLTAAVSVALAIRESCGLPARIRWPNDILLAGKKVSGILTEMEAETDFVNFLVLGIGINVNTKASELPKGATSIFEEIGHRFSRVDLMKILLMRLEENYTMFKSKGFSPIIKEWHNLSATLGKRVRVTCINKKIEAEAIGLDLDGALIVRLDNGFQEKILSGDLIILR